MTTWNGSRRKGVFSRMEKIRIKYFTDKIEIPDQWDSLSISVNEKTQKIDVLFT